MINENKITFGELEEYKKHFSVDVSYKGNNLGLITKHKGDNRCWVAGLHNAEEKKIDVGKNTKDLEYFYVDLDDLKQEILKDEESIVKILRLDK